jgi:hypothetical protein
VVSFTLLPLYPRGKSHLYLLGRRLCGPQGRSGRCGEAKILDPSWIRTLARRLSIPQPVAVPTELTRLMPTRSPRLRRDHGRQGAARAMSHSCSQNANRLFGVQTRVYVPAVLLIEFTSVETSSRDAACVQGPSNSLHRCFPRRGAHTCNLCLLVTGRLTAAVRWDRPTRALSWRPHVRTQSVN